MQIKIIVVFEFKAPLKEFLKILAHKDLLNDDYLLDRTIL